MASRWPTSWASSFLIFSSMLLWVGVPFFFFFLLGGFWVLGEGERKREEEEVEKKERERERKTEHRRRRHRSPLPLFFFSFPLQTHVSPRVVSLSPASSSVGTLGGGFLVPKMRRMVFYFSV